jgi:hypothetical protein
LQAAFSVAAEWRWYGVNEPQASIKMIYENAFICFVLAMTLTSLWVRRHQWQSFVSSIGDTQKKAKK